MPSNKLNRDVGYGMGTGAILGGLTGGPLGMFAGAGSGGLRQYLGDKLTGGAESMAAKGAAAGAGLGGGGGALLTYLLKSRLEKDPRFAALKGLSGLKAALLGGAGGATVGGLSGGLEGAIGDLLQLPND